MRRFISTLFVLALVASLGLVMAVPVAAAGPLALLPKVEFQKTGASTVDWTTINPKFGAWSALLSLDVPTNEARVAVVIPDSPDFDALTSLGYWYYIKTAAVDTVPDAALKGSTEPDFVDFTPVPGYAAPYAVIELDKTGDGVPDVWVVEARYADDAIGAWEQRSMDTSNYFHAAGAGVPAELALPNIATLATIQDHTFFDSAKVLKVKVMMGSWGAYITGSPEAYVDDVDVDFGGTTYALEPRVINTTQTKGYNTIQAAIDDASAGDTINVAAGTYQVADESWDGKRCIYINKDLTLRGAGSGLTVLDAKHTYSVLNEPGDFQHHCTVVWNEAQNITIEGLTVKGGDYGIRNTTVDLGGGALNSATFTDVVVEDNYGLGIVFENDIGAATFTGCQANNSGDIGIYFTPNCAANTVTLTNTSANSNGHVGFSCQGSIADLSISGGTFNNNTGGMFHCDYERYLGPYYGFGIELRNCVGTVEGVTAQGNGFGGPDIVGERYGAEGGAGIVVKDANNNITITGANLQNNMNGLWIEDPDSVENWGAVCVGSVEIYSNNIEGNQEFGVLNCTDCPIDATNNWWGDISGPKQTTTNPGGLGDEVSDNVNYEPWLTREFATVLADNIAYFGMAMVHLNTGWNTFSTPIALDPACDTWAEYVALGDGLNIHLTSPAYAFDPTVTLPWVPLTGDNADYPLKPCDAIYVRMAKPDIAAILFSPEVSVPSKELYAGWNLVSLSYLDGPGLKAKKALVSVEEVSDGLTGYKVVVSPPVNQPGWIYTGGAIENWSDPSQCPPDGWMLMTRGYWVFMLNDGTLAGFAFTPVSLGR